MPYRFLEGFAIADVVFEATGASLGELFVAAAHATVNTMVEPLEEVRAETSREIRLQHHQLDLLLFDFLQELVYYKDADALLLVVPVVDISEEDGEFTLAATGFGEEIELARHHLRADVKAVTLHKFELEETSDGWRCFVILDV
jgi:SHS2 domain-containing protein